MTTKVVISAPDNSLYDLMIYVESRDGQTREGQPITVPPRTTAEPLYVTQSTRLVIEEVPRAPQPKE